ncbi:hypothetical protein ESCO_000516 [Escovopsis weberi]|uniref:Serine/threonine-protein phosphatase 4 regulatory subunit 2 n=1 Tax=Escovopsis weberi TaxID=150374 RepID=A0A0M8N140_ESCWE|nr:hypothetical protein ESCO_000516 [Escovopsis weberi]
MDIDVDNDLLSTLAAGDLIEQRAWPALRSDILARLDNIAKNDFPIPALPPPPSRLHLSDHRPASPPLSPSPDRPLPEPSSEAAAPAEPAEPVEQGPLPKQIDDMLAGIKRKVESFEPYPPHTIQRLAELILRPTAHYKALASWLHAVDRTVQVTSGTNAYPLPPPIPDMAAMRLNGEAADPRDPAAHISWTNPTTSAAAAAVGSDEALGGALLTPIPWLARRSPEPSALPPAAAAQGAQIHSEGTQTIDGPNGVGSIETVSVSVNGVPSTGHARGVTQGELLRQEQRAGVVPVSQLARLSQSHGHSHAHAHAHDTDEGARMDEDAEDEVPHARGPEEIGVGDTGPQTVSTSLVGEGGGIEMQGIDVEAAVGRKHADEDRGQPGRAGGGGEDRGGVRQTSPGAESVGSKREAEEDIADPASKKVKEDTTMEDDDKAVVEQQQQQQQQQQQPEAESCLKTEDDVAPGDKMET